MSVVLPSLPSNDDIIADSVARYSAMTAVATL